MRAGVRLRGDGPGLVFGRVRCVLGHARRATWTRVFVKLPVVERRRARKVVAGALRVGATVGVGDLFPTGPGCRIRWPVGITFGIQVEPSVPAHTSDGDV